MQEEEIEGHTDGSGAIKKRPPMAVKAWPWAGWSQMGQLQRRFQSAAIYRVILSKRSEPKDLRIYGSKRFFASLRMTYRTAGARVSPLRLADARHLSRGERLGCGAPFSHSPKGIKPAQPLRPIRKGRRGVFV